MRCSVLRAYITLIYFDLCLSRHNFTALHDRVRYFSVGAKSEFVNASEVCLAVDVASIWYWKEVLCLQRSAATTCLLRRSGFPAQMVIGVQQMPFRSHAWVELNGRVVNDKPYTPEMFSVMERC
jgi:hypothetical protein